MYGIDKIRDNRSWQKTKRQYKNAGENERIAMLSLSIYLSAHGHEDVFFEKVDEDERLADGKHHSAPDYYMSVDGKVYSFEIKVMMGKRPLNDTIIFKPSSIISMVKKPKLYPNGYGFFCTKNDWTMMSAKKIAKYPLKRINEWSNENVTKKGFTIPESHFKFKPWISPPDFLTY